jgi:DNA-binding MltR family transcriptional regulator
MQDDASGIDLSKYDWELFFNELQEESERSAAVIAGAFLEALLGDLLKAFMVQDKSTVVSLIGDERNSSRSLSGFGSRILACYCLGLISKQEFEDLKTIQSIRNRFAHELQGYSFDNPQVAKLCAQLKIPEEIYRVSKRLPVDHRSRYLLCVSLLVQQIGLRILATAKTPRVSPQGFSIGQYVEAKAKELGEG